MIFALSQVSSSNDNTSIVVSILFIRRVEWFWEKFISLFCKACVVWEFNFDFFEKRLSLLVVFYIECQKIFTSTLRKVANLSSMRMLILNLKYEWFDANKKSTMWARKIFTLWIVSRLSIFDFRHDHKRFLFIEVIRIHAFYKNQFNSKFVAKFSNFTSSRVHVSRRSF